MSADHSKQASPEDAPLRERAEARILEAPPTEAAAVELDPVGLIHELRVHQAELELQNEQLRETEMQLTAARDHLSDLYEFAPVGYLTLGVEGKIEEANLTATRLLGTDRRQLLKSRISDFVERASQDDLFLHLRAAFSDSTRQACQVETRRADGSLVTLRLESEGFGKGERRRCRTALVDVTETRQKTERLHLLATAVAHLGEGVLIATGELDLPGPAILFVNEAICRMTGYSEGELIGKTPRMFQGERSDRATLDGIRKTLAAGRSCLVELVNYRKDGTPYDAELFIAPIFDDAGRRTHFVAVQRDITKRKEFERALRESEGRFRGFIEATSDAVYLASADWSEIRFLEGGGAIPGTASPCEAWIDRCIPSEDRTLVLQAIQESARTGGVFELEHRVIRADGTIAWVLSHAVPIRDDRGEVAEWMGTALDVTRRRNAEKVARDREELLRAVLNTAADAIVTIDRAGTITDANPAAEEMFGYSRPEMVGANVSLLMPDPVAKEHDGYLGRYHATGEAKIIGKAREMEGRRHDGSIFPIELSVSKVDDLGLFTGVIRDISRRKLDEMLLVREKAFTENLIETAQCIMLVVDHEGRVVRYNRELERLSGRKLAETKGADFCETFLPRREWKRARRFREKLMKSCASLGSTFPITTVDGEERLIEWQDAPLRDPQGKELGLLCTGRDVTDRRRLEREVYRAGEEEKSRISRELQDGLGSLLSGLQMLAGSLSRKKAAGQELDLGEIEAIEQYAAEAMAQARSLSHGLHPLADGPGALARALESLAQSTGRVPGWTCRLELPDSSIGVADALVANHLYRIAQEATTNALKHSGGTQLTIRLEATSSGGFSLVVEDDGRGGAAGRITEKGEGIGLHTMAYRAHEIDARLSIDSGESQGTRVGCVVPGFRVKGGDGRSEASPDSDGSGSVEGGVGERASSPPRDSAI